ncbi:MAG: prephenate dehydrogenase/arogenate dehydrogenase family protein [Acidobacteriota bacterium]
MNTVVIAGVGLIGGSFALAIRQAGFAGRIVGVSSSGTIQKAIARGVVDEGLPMEQAAAQADLLYISTTIQRILDLLGEVDAHVRPGTIITDAGSTKREICARAADKVRRGTFIGGHPMAGKESRGVEEAEAGLFSGRPYVLTGRAPELEKWLELIGARLVFLDPQEHDRLIALVSHLPQMLATALASVIGEDPKAASVAGPGAKDMTRLAFSAYDIWADILATNGPAIDAALGSFITRLEALRAQLRSPAMEKVFERAAASAAELRKSS